MDFWCLQIYRYAASWWYLTMGTTELGGLDLTVSNRKNIRAARLYERSNSHRDCILLYMMILRGSCPSPHVRHDWVIYLRNPILKR